MTKQEIYNNIVDSLNTTKLLLTKPSTRCSELLLQVAANAFTAYAYVLKLSFGNEDTLKSDLWYTANNIIPVLQKLEETGDAHFDKSMLFKCSADETKLFSR